VLIYDGSSYFKNAIAVCIGLQTETL